jgi:hypothetical protein
MDSGVGGLAINAIAFRSGSRWTSVPSSWPHIGTNNTAAGADHARAEGWYGHGIRPDVGRKRRLMMAQ